MTNDGELAHQLTHPRYGVEKTYLAQVAGRPGPEVYESLRRGVRLAEVNFKTMESRVCPGLFFAGELLDIDGVTGGFNFQAAWTTGYIAGRAAAE